MNAQGIRIIDTYENLIDNYSPERSCAFLRACWLLDEGASFESSALSRMIFSEGNSQEVYTREERVFIGSVASDVDFNCFQMPAERGSINCRVLSIDFGLSHNIMYDSIKFMKIFKKSLEGFNVFSFVCADGIHLGCSCIENHEHTRDCILSPLITPNINWKVLINIFLFRNEATNLYEYYTGIVRAIHEIQNCFNYSEENEEYPISFSYYYDDNDPIDHLGKVRLSDHIDYVSEAQPVQKDLIFDAEQFELDVEECFADLDYIKTLKANPLEMLFEAESALEQDHSLSSQNMEHYDITSGFPIDYDRDENIELLDDPLALVKKLKNELAYN